MPSRRHVLAATGAALLGGCTGLNPLADDTPQPDPEPFLNEPTDWAQPGYDAANTTAPPGHAAPERIPQSADWTAQSTATEIGDSAGPIVADGIVYLVAAGTSVGETFERLVALDAHSGEKRWQMEVTGSGYAYPPVVAGETVYWLAAADTLHAINPADGSVRWNHRGANHHPPLVAHGLLLTVGGSTDSPELVALDPRTGESYWRRDEGQRDWRLVAADDRAFYATLTAADEETAQLHALDPKTGESHWRTDAVAPRRAALTGTYLFATAGRPDARTLTAFDTETRQVEWTDTRNLQRAVGDGEVVNGSQTVAAVADSRVLVVHDFHGYTANRLLAYDAESGEVVWTVDGSDGLFPCCPPVIVGDQAYHVVGQATDDGRTSAALSVRDLTDGRETTRVELQSAAPGVSLLSGTLVVADGRLLLRRRPDNRSVSLSVR